MIYRSLFFGWSIDELLCLVEGGVALVHELVRVVEEARVLLEVVRLAIEEGIQFPQVGRVLCLSIWLRTVVGVHMHVLEVVLCVGHVLAIIDLIEFSLAISQLPCVLHTSVLVLAEVGTDQRSIVIAVVGADDLLNGEGSSEKSKCSPS